MATGNVLSLTAVLISKRRLNASGDIPVILPVIPSIMIPMLKDNERIKLSFGGGF